MVDELQGLNTRRPLSPVYLQSDAKGHLRISEKNLELDTRFSSQSSIHRALNKLNVSHSCNPSRLLLLADGQIFGNFQDKYSVLAHSDHVSCTVMCPDGTYYREVNAYCSHDIRHKLAVMANFHMLVSPVGSLATLSLPLSALSGFQERIFRSTTLHEHARWRSLSPISMLGEIDLRSYDWENVVRQNAQGEVVVVSVGGLCSLTLSASGTRAAVSFPCMVSKELLDPQSGIEDSKYEYTYDQVTQLFPVNCCPSQWRYPMQLALIYWNAHNPDTKTPTRAWENWTDGDKGGLEEKENKIDESFMQNGKGFKVSDTTGMPSSSDESTATTVRPSKSPSFFDIVVPLPKLQTPHSNTPKMSKYDNLSHQKSAYGYNDGPQRGSWWADSPASLNFLHTVHGSLPNAIGVAVEWTPEATYWILPSGSVQVFILTHTLLANSFQFLITKVT